MSLIVNFAKFWYDFVIGDDWLVAAVVVIGLLIIGFLARSAWWLMPVAVVLVLGVSLWRATRH